MARPVIALLTDFGLRDHYVAAMKGVVLGLCPDVTFIDISHDIPPQDVLAGALELEAVTPYLPRETVVVGVVDPGVGTGRRGVAIRADGLRFVGPDNGLFSLALNGHETEAVELTNRRYSRESISRTFEGRDRFAPAAGWLACGVSLSEFGPPVADLVSLELPAPIASADRIDGEVVRVDRFGNLVTNIHRDTLRAVNGPLEIIMGAAMVTGLSATYAESSPGRLCAVIGSTDRLEISVRGGSAADATGASRGTAVQVRGRSGA
jgi:S-adenosylmethionine hydrolase